MLSPILSILAYLLALGALLFPLPLGLASVMLGVLAVVAAKGVRRWTIMGLLGIGAGLAGTAGGLLIGIVITQP